MDSNNTQGYNNDYKERQHQEELLDNLLQNLNEAANNLDEERIITLITSFEIEHYSSLNTLNKQSFDLIKATVSQKIAEIRKKKELLAQKQRELQIKTDSLNELKSIQQSINKAKTETELNKVKEKYMNWQKKSKKIKYGWDFNSKINNLEQEVVKSFGPEDGIKQLKDLIESAEKKGGFENDIQIKDWMNKYPLNSFHEVYKKDVQELMDKAFSLVLTPENKELQLLGLSPAVLFMSPTQSYAVADLKKILNSDSHNYEAILDWIYTYRNVNFNDLYRQTIATIIPADFGITLNRPYSIPSISGDINNLDEKNKLIKETITNYFGILLCGNSFDSTKKIAFTDIYEKSKVADALAQISPSIENTDDLLQSKNDNELLAEYSFDNEETSIKFEKVNSELDNHEESLTIEVENTEKEIETIDNETNEIGKDIETLILPLYLESTEVHEESIKNDELNVTTSVNEELQSNDDKSTSNETEAINKFSAINESIESILGESPVVINIPSIQHVKEDEKNSTISSAEEITDAIVSEDNSDSSIEENTESSIQNSIEDSSVEEITDTIVTEDNSDSSIEEDTESLIQNSIEDPSVEEITDDDIVLENTSDSYIEDDNEFLIQNSIEDSSVEEITDAKIIEDSKILGATTFSIFEDSNINNDETVDKTQEESFDYSNPYQLSPVDVHNIEEIYALTISEKVINDIQPEITNDAEKSFDTQNINIDSAKTKI